jgi:IS30 family transposase
MDMDHNKDQRQIIIWLSHIADQRKTLLEREEYLIRKGLDSGLSLRIISRALGYSHTLLSQRKRRGTLFEEN